MDFFSLPVALVPEVVLVALLEHSDGHDQHQGHEPGNQKFEFVIL